MRFLQDVEDGELKLNYVVEYIIYIIYMNNISDDTQFYMDNFWIILTNTGSLYCVKNGCLEIW